MSLGQDMPPVITVALYLANVIVFDKLVITYIGICTFIGYWLEMKFYYLTTQTVTDIDIT
jgi:hypothetical protein